MCKFEPLFLSLHQTLPPPPIIALPQQWCSLHIYLKPPSSFTTSATSKHYCCPTLYLRYYLHFQKHQLHYHYQHTICFLFTSSTFYLKAVVSINPNTIMVLPSSWHHCITTSIIPITNLLFPLHCNLCLCLCLIAYLPSSA